MSKNTSNQAQTNDLSAVFPETVTVSVGNREVEVAPFKFKSLLKVLNHVSTILGDTAYIDQYNLMSTLLRGVAQHPDEVVAILKISTGIQEESFYDNLSEVDGVRLAIATWEVNSDFFSRHLGDKIKTLFGPQEEAE